MNRVERHSVRLTDLSRVEELYRLDVGTFKMIQLHLFHSRQHPSYGDCLEVKREYYQNCSVLGYVTQYSQSAAHSCEQFLQGQQIRFVILGPLRHA